MASRGTILCNLHSHEIISAVAHAFGRAKRIHELTYEQMADVIDVASRNSVAGYCAGTTECTGVTLIRACNAWPAEFAGVLAMMGVGR